MTTAAHPTADDERSVPSWTLILAIAAGLLAGLWAGACGGRINWGQVGECAAVAVSSFLHEAVLDIFSGPTPDLDRERLAALALEHGAPSVRCAVEELVAGLGNTPPGAASALPEHDAQVLTRAQRWLDSL